MELDVSHHLLFREDRVKNFFLTSSFIADEYQGRPFIAMELLTGVVFTYRIAGRALPAEEIAAMGADLADAQRVAERIRLHVGEAPIQVCGGKARLGVTISIGVAASLGAEDTPDLLLKRADEALYQAKTGGRNRVVAHAA